MPGKKTEDNPEEKPEPEENKVPAYRALVELSSMGIHLVVSTFVGGAIGYYLDTHVFGTFPWLSLIFLFFGIASGFLKMFRLAGIGRENRNDGSDKKDR